MGSSAPGGPSTDDPSPSADGRLSTTRVSVDGPADEDGTVSVTVPEPAPPEPSATPPTRAAKHRRLRPVQRYRAAARRRPLLTAVLTAFGVVVLVVACLVLDAAWQSYRVYRDIKGSIAVLQEAKAGVAHGTLPSSEQFFHAAAEATDARNRVAHPDLGLRFAGSLPGMGGPMRALRAASAAAAAEARVATDLGNLSQELIGKGGGTGGSFAVYHDGAIDVQLLQGLPPKLEGLSRDLQSAQQAIRRIPPVPLLGHKIAKIKTKALKDSSQAITLLDKAIVGSRLLPGVLGADGPRTYFVAVQNNADQRGTGGAVLGYALVRFSDGRIRILSGGGINAIDNKRIGFHVGFPAGVAWYLHEALGVPRINNGANYTADFPLVGQSWVKMAAAATGRQIDGAIAIDPFAIAAALRGQGALHVPAYPGTIDAHNLVQVTEHDQYLLSRQQQQDLPHELIKSAFKLLEHPKNFVGLASGLADSVAERHVQVWMADPSEEALVTRLGWDGGIRSGPGDFVGVVYDKRIRGKQDFWSQESLNYHVTLSASGTASADAVVGMSDQIPPGQPPRIVSHVQPYGLNAAMLNLYVPRRATLQSVTPSGVFPQGFVSPPLFFDYLHPQGFVEHVEGAFRVFTQTVTPYPGHPKTVEYRYTVPDAVHATSGNHVYVLTIPHQPLYRDPIVDVTIQLPAGAHVLSSTPGLIASGSTLTLRTHLTKDLTLRVVY